MCYSSKKLKYNEIRYQQSNCVYYAQPQKRTEIVKFLLSKGSKYVVFHRRRRSIRHLLPPRGNTCRLLEATRVDSSRYISERKKAFVAKKQQINRERLANIRRSAYLCNVNGSLLTTPLSAGSKTLSTLLHFKSHPKGDFLFSFSKVTNAPPRAVRKSDSMISISRLSDSHTMLHPNSSSYSCKEKRCPKLEEREYFSCLKGTPMYRAFEASEVERFQPHWLFRHCTKGFQTIE